MMHKLLKAVCLCAGATLLAGGPPACGQDVAETQDENLCVAVLERGSFVVGWRHATSGLHCYRRDTLWTHLGWPNARSNGLAFESGHLGTLFLASGNGLLQSRDGGASWRIATDWRVTEVQDVALDPNTPGHVYIATAYGVWRSTDNGATWAEANRGIPKPEATFTPSIAVDRRHAGHLIVGSEKGLFRSTDGGRHWVPVGPRNVAIRDISQSKVRPEQWLIGTRKRGVLLSTDGGHSWHFASGGISEATIYTVASDPTDPERMAAGGYQTGVYVSTSGGKDWTQYTEGLPVPTIHGLVFDPNMPGRLWVGTVGAGVYYADDPEKGWTDAGLPKATVQDMLFVDGDLELKEDKEEQ